MLTVKQDDLFPDVEATVEDENGNPVDISLALVKFSMRSARNPETVIDQVNATLVDGPTGKVAYHWASGDTSVPGTYDAEFIVSPPIGDAFRVPTTGYLTVVIEENAG